MDNALGYEPRDWGSIPYGGATLTGCIVSQVRRPALEVGGRRFESCHPDQFKDADSNLKKSNLYFD